MSSLADQRRYWTEWNAAKGARALSETSTRQKRDVLSWLESAGRTDLEVLEVGCGAAWLTPWLKRFGRVTATDLSEEAVRAAEARIPDVRFIGGDFLTLDLPNNSFDAAVALEVLAHVADQPTFLRKVADALKPGGRLFLATQNAPVLRDLNRVEPPAGQLRHWVDRHELEALLEKDFELEDLYSATPRANRGFWRLANARAVNAPIRAVLGDRLERMKERAWLGWTLIALARKRGA